MVTFPAAEHHRPLAGTKLYSTAWWQRHIGVNNLSKVVTQLLLSGCHSVHLVCHHHLHLNDPFSRWLASSFTFFLHWIWKRTLAYGFYFLHACRMSILSPNQQIYSLTTLLTPTVVVRLRLSPASLSVFCTISKIQMQLVSPNIDTEMVHHESWKPIYFLVKTSSPLRHKNTMPTWVFALLWVLAFSGSESFVVIIDWRVVELCLHVECVWVKQSRMGVADDHGRSLPPTTTSTRGRPHPYPPSSNRTSLTGSTSSVGQHSR